jgi:hypothetical protein
MECYFWKAKISNFQLDHIANELLPLDSNVRAKLTLNSHSHIERSGFTI